MKPILEIKNISKKFRIGHNHLPYLSLRDSITSFFSENGKATTEEFWALKDVSFNVYEGESIGIIGKNGAGKSTLLKILSKITPPTEGKIISRGRIASLLEVGTGFHPELSGRENIFLNGSILRMKRREIQKKFDEIVDFSGVGVEQFLDTPLKHYSTGMQLRLAFSVAAFLEPEILIIDEVLAVGDAEFQKKCLGKMDDVSKSGRTVLFVSHNMGVLRNITKKSILLSNGILIQQGNTRDVINEYLGKELVSSGEVLIPLNSKLPVQMSKLTIANFKGEITNVLPLHKSYKIKIKIIARVMIKHFIVGIGFTNMEDVIIRNVWSKPVDLEEGEYEYIFHETQIHLVVGKYKLLFGITSREQTSIQFIRDAMFCEFEEEVNKEIALHTSSGVILNQMPVEIIKLN